MSLQSQIINFNGFCLFSSTEMSICISKVSIEHCEHTEHIEFIKHVVVTFKAFEILKQLLIYKFVEYLDVIFYNRSIQFGVLITMVIGKVNPQ